MRTTNWQLRMAGTLCLALLAPLFGCSTDAADNPNITDQPGPSAPAVINLVHAAPDVATLDLYIDKQKMPPTLDFRLATGNLQITPTSHSVELRDMGAPPTKAPVLSATISLLPGSRTLLALVGKQSSADPAEQLQLIAAPYGTPDSQNVKVRLLNAVPGSAALSLLAGNSPLATGAGFATASGYGVTPMLAQATKLGLRRDRTTDDLALVTLPAMGAPGEVITVLALGEMNPLAADDKHFFGAAVLDEKVGAVFDLARDINTAGPMGSLLLVHAAPDGPAVDVVDAKSNKLITNLSYEQASPLVALSPGEAPVSVQKAGTTNALLSATLRVLPGTDWTLVAEETAQGGLALKALPRPAGAGPSWRLVHAVSDGDAWNALAGNKTVVSGLAYGQATPLIDSPLPAPTWTLVGSAGQGSKFSVAVPQAVADASQSQLTTVITTGTLMPTSKLAVLAVLDNTATGMAPPTVFQLATMSVAMLGAAGAP